MTSKLSLDNNEEPNYDKVHKWKELLYELFYEIKSEILGCKIEIEEDEYQENVQSINIPKLVQYIHDSIQILINKKIYDTKLEIEKKEEKKKKENSSSDDNTPPPQLLEDEKKQYENIIRKLESKERFLMRIQFHSKLQRDAMENKIGEYLEMEEEFEEMKTKLKYEEGRFLENDRKDNEVIIIRGENSILKQSIVKLEKQIKTMEAEKQKKDKMITKLQGEIKQLNTKNEELQKQIEFYNSNSLNINNQTGINNNNSKNVILCYNNNFTDKKNTISNVSSLKSNIFPFQKIKNKFLQNKNNSGDLLNNTRNESMERTSSEFLNKYCRRCKINKNNICLNNSSVKGSHLHYGNNEIITARKNNHIHMPIFNNIKMNNLNIIKKIVSSGGSCNNTSRSISKIKNNTNRVINFKS
jgi:hypothetical protein